ncbi:type VII secretion protein EccE [Nocardia sp. alder85J]|uniref:type VII secretion protein EccE n=1 Tax=Nocardia sp. alder85J TaxID=2862949 RepID=UPI001CD7AD82|nr:type VII secretion protein EccE [Nocardia sp. alder85J]MCX4092202.1 type VII secretion protein EccE [Nocardia sp. alder85J]
MTATDPGTGSGERVPFAIVVLAGSLLVAALWGRPMWWIGPVVVGVAVLLVAVEIGGHTVVRWLLNWAAFRFGLESRALQRGTPPQLRDVEVPAGTCGIGADGATLIAMVQLAPDLDLPTVIADETIYTEDTVPVDLLLPLREQYGIDVDIDIVTTGRRVRPTGSYSMLYDQLIGAQPVIGHRLTWLVVRLDQERNLTALARRGPVATVAPKALATAAVRIASQLREHGIAAHPLPADELRGASRLLHAGVEPADLREHWSRLEPPIPNRVVTTGIVDWSRLGGLGLEDCWTWNRGWTTVVISLPADSGSQAAPRVLVRYVGPPMDELPDYLRPLRGQQSQAFRATLPTGVSVRDLPSDESGADVVPDEVLPELVLPIGPNGQILGSISGHPRHTLALPLYDPSRYNPRRRSIDVHADLPVAQQIVLRAMIVGAEVEVHSARPQRWWQLVSAVGDPSALRLAPDPAQNGNQAGFEPPTITVFDQLPPRSSAAQTTVTISNPDTPPRRAADLLITQVGDTSVDVRIPMRTVRVDLIEPHGETRYFDSGTESAAGPPPADGFPPALGSAPTVPLADRPSARVMGQ